MITLATLCRSPLSAFPKSLSRDMFQLYHKYPTDLSIILRVKRMSQKTEKKILMSIPVFNMHSSVQGYTFSYIFLMLCNFNI